MEITSMLNDKVEFTSMWIEKMEFTSMWNLKVEFTSMLNKKVEFTNVLNEKVEFTPMLIEKVELTSMWKWSRGNIFVGGISSCMKRNISKFPRYHFTAQTCKTDTRLPTNPFQLYDA